jgi:hypothetical protein
MEKAGLADWDDQREQCVVEIVRQGITSPGRVRGHRADRPGPDVQEQRVEGPRRCSASGSGLPDVDQALDFSNRLVDVIQGAAGAGE